MAKLNEKGWWINGRGEAVNKDMVRVNEQLKDEMVEEIIKDAVELQYDIKIFRDNAMKNVENYFGLLLQNYGIDEKQKSKKGNVTLENFSATAKIEIRISETLKFDEKIQVAKMKVDEYLNDVTKDSIPEIKVLITKAFEVDKEGNIDNKKIFALKSYDIKDQRWLEAMEIIDESKKVAHTKSYIRFYTRPNINEPYKLVNLDIANC